MSNLIATRKINNNFDEYEYLDGTKKEVPIVWIDTRQEAVELAEDLTVKALRKKNAFRLLHLYRNSFENHRNYEIENYLERLSKVNYKIKERCPFNNFSYWDSDLPQNKS